MTRTHIAALLIGSTLVLSATSAEAGPIRDRQETQRDRIVQGLESGSLTLHEARTLRGEQRAIDRARHRALSDGYISAREARRLSGAQHRANHHIYYLKHNRRVAE